MRFVCMAIPKRSHIVNYLKSHIPGLEIVWDKHRSARLTWMSMLESIGADAAVVVEDDIVLTKNFVAKVQLVIASHPNELIQFHSRTKDDLTKGSRHRPGGSYLNNQCVYFPPGMAQKIMRFAETCSVWEEHPSGTDVVIAEFLKKNKLQYWNHCPSLVDHLPVSSEIDPRRSRHRRSTSFQDPESTGLLVEILPPKRPRKA